MLIFFITFVLQMKTCSYIKLLTIRKVVTLLFITTSLAAFATLGDGGKKSYSKTLLSAKSYNYNFKTFSLKSGYNYRGNHIISTQPSDKYIMLNTVITYQKGNNTYLMPLKRKVLLDKVTFKPSGR